MGIDRREVLRLLIGMAATPAVPKLLPGMTFLEAPLEAIDPTISQPLNPDGYFSGDELNREMERFQAAVKAAVLELIFKHHPFPYPCNDESISLMVEAVREVVEDFS